MAESLLWVGIIGGWVGMIWLTVVGFNQSQGWGMMVLGGIFCCFILWIVFAVKHWEESKKPVMWIGVGYTLAFTGMIMGGGSYFSEESLEEMFGLEEASEVVPAGTPSPALPPGLDIPAIGGPLPPSAEPSAAATPVFTPPPSTIAPPPPPAAAPAVPAQPAIATPAAPEPVAAPTGEVDPRLLEPADLLLSEAEKDWNAGRRRRAIATMKNALAILKRHLGETNERVTDLESQIELAESQVQ